MHEPHNPATNLTVMSGCFRAKEVFEFALLLGFASQCVAQITPIALTNVPVDLAQLAVAGSRLFGIPSSYPPSATGLRIFDISNPANPVDLGFNDGKGNANQRALAVSGDYLYYSVADELRILNIANPAQPVLVAQLAGNYPAITVQGNYAYLTTLVGSSLWRVGIYDVSNPTNPVTLGKIDTQAFARTAVAGNYAYVADGGLLIADISNPTNPATLGYVSNLFAADVVLYGSFAYVATGWTNNLYGFYLGNPTNPIPIFEGGWQPDTSRLLVSGNYLLAQQNWMGGFAFNDISNPTNTSFAGRIRSDYTPMAVAVSGNYAYMASGSLNIYSLGLPSPALNLAATGSNLVASWAAPTLAFSLQRTTNLHAPNWVTATNLSTPVGNQNQINLPRPAASTFYRLVSR